MTAAEVEEVLDALRATRRVSASRPGSTASSCTARTATCCSSPSAPGATGGRRVGRAARLRPGSILRVRAADRPRAGRRPSDLDRRLHVARSAAASAPKRSRGIAACARRHGRARLREPVGGLAHGALRALDRQLPPPARRVPAARPRRCARRSARRVPIVAASRINDPDTRRAGARSRRLRPRRDDARA